MIMPRRLMIYVIIMIIMLLQIVQGIFTIVPETQYVYLNDTVTFECATTNMTVITFFYGTDVEDNVTDLSNGGKRTTFTAVSAINGTNIVCFSRMGSLTNVSDVAYLYIQGPPDSVSNLQGYQLDYCCMFISWDPPYTLPGLTVQYIISVGTEQHELISTNYTYCPLNLTNKEYQFNITTSNKAGNGSISNITVGFQSDAHFSVAYNHNDAYLIGNKWVLSFKLKNHQLCIQPILKAMVISCIHNTSDCYYSNNITINNDILVTSNFLPTHMLFTAKVILQYVNGQTFTSQNEVVISTHDLQEAKITLITIAQLCFQFQYVNGSKNNKTQLQFVSSNSITLNYTLSHDKLDFTECITLPTNNWTLYACNELPCIINPAVTIFNIVIISEELDSLTSSDLFTSKEHVSVSIKISPSFTPGQQHTSLGFIVGIVVFIMVMFLATSVSCVIVSFTLIKRKKKLTQLNDMNNSANMLNQSSSEPVSINEHAEAEVTAGRPVALKYINIERDPDAPAVPPSFDPQRITYTEIAIDTTNNGVYDKVSHGFSHDHSEINSTGTYSRLNQFTEGVYDKCQHPDTHTKKQSRKTTTSQYSTLSMSGQHQATEELTQKGLLVPSQYSVIPNENIVTPLVKKELTHKDLSLHVIPHLTTKWREVGLALALTPPQLDDIEENNQGLSDVLQIWEELATRPFTWSTLLSVLRSPVLNEYQLADKLENILC